MRLQEWKNNAIQTPLRQCRDTQTMGVSEHYSHYYWVCPYIYLPIHPFVCEFIHSSECLSNHPTIQSYDRPSFTQATRKPKYTLSIKHWLKEPRHPNVWHFQEETIFCNCSSPWRILASIYGIIYSQVAEVNDTNLANKDNRRCVIPSLSPNSLGYYKK